MAQVEAGPITRQPGLDVGAPGRVAQLLDQRYGAQRTRLQRTQESPIAVAWMSPDTEPNWLGSVRTSQMMNTARARGIHAANKEAAKVSTP